MLKRLIQGIMRVENKVARDWRIEWSADGEVIDDAQRDRRDLRRIDRPKVLDAFRSVVTEVVMAFRSKIYFIILGIVAQLLFFGDVRADELQPSDNAAEQEIVTAATHHHNGTFVVFLDGDSV